MQIILELEITSFLLAQIAGKSNRTHIGFLEDTERSM